MKFSLEAVFHRKLKSLNVTKGQQGYIMGAFRDACKELGVDYACEPEGGVTSVPDLELEEWSNAVRQNTKEQREALDKLKCVHGTPFQEPCDYCAALELLRVKP